MLSLFLWKFLELNWTMTSGCGDCISDGSRHNSKLSFGSSVSHLHLGYHHRHLVQWSSFSIWQWNAEKQFANWSRCIRLKIFPLLSVDPKFHTHTIARTDTTHSSKFMTASIVYTMWCGSIGICTIRISIQIVNLNTKDRLCCSNRSACQKDFVFIVLATIIRQRRIEYFVRDIC